MKLHTTQKYIRNLYGNSVFSVGYCDAWHLLRGVDPFAYNAGIYGWNCDYYHLDGVIICTGYRPHGRSNYDITREFEKRAKDIYNNREIRWEERDSLISAVRSEWISALENM